MSRLNCSVDILRATIQLQLPKDPAGRYETIKNKYSEVFLNKFYSNSYICELLTQ